MSQSTPNVMALASSQAADLSDAHTDIELLHAISVELIGEQDRVQLYGKIVDAAVAICGSQFGTMQLLCPPGDPSGHGGELSLLAYRGLPSEAVEFWQWVPPAAHSSCTAALKAGGRAIIPDFEEWDEIAGTEDLLAFRRTGIRSAQTTPLRSRGGKLLGMISTHWSEPHNPSERDLRLLDILARQAADLLERTIAEEELRDREQELDRTCAALRESEGLQKLLAGELSHRVKNMLATVQAIATQTLRHCEKPGDFVTSFSGRIQSMSRVHSQLSANDWQGAQLSEIISDQMNLGPADETRICASGPAVLVEANVVPTIAMMMHELGTNSLKYGALSKPDGKVDICWTVSGDALRLRWIEQGGPPVKAPVRRGFGTALIERSAGGVGGKAEMLLKADGIEWELLLPLPTEAPRHPMPNPLSNDRATGALQVADSDAGPDAQPLRGKRLLVIEDEPLVAMEMATQLSLAGADIIGQAGNTSSALQLIAEERFDAALLDANLGGHAVDEIAACLTRNNIPFAFVSGYGRESLPKSFANAELMSKPFDPDRLLTVACGLVDRNVEALRPRGDVANR
ncbi:GAF domain-containing protein [Sphingomonas sp. NSE70-1]|uniref:histidine kinase n=1 Tax=Sphingomonas caseinilyticus TaxID=2908205 RepID=A0ABT0RX63_9SPHN|nr:HWE histidine kinase domain-containing protein [Sphingomonas caseinilyticus]MCL6699620.1 GAF domain-containing protein [Sphingomonas caseinilyticus]